MFPNSMAGLADAGRGSGRVSILMRTRDRPILLARALASVLNQTHSDWHLSLVNDGGARAPVQNLIDEYSTAFAGRLTVTHLPAAIGMEAASNVALAASSGAFVCVHDDDDSWHPEFLEATVDFLNRADSPRFAAVVTHCTIVDERLEAGGIVEEGRSFGHLSPSHVDYAAMLCENLFPPISLLVRREAMDAVGHFNTEMPVLGDWDFNLRLLRVGDIAVIPRRLACYHHRSGGDASPYANTVTGGALRHREGRVLYRNSMVRDLAASDPAAPGLVHVLLGDAKLTHSALTEKLEGVRTTLLERSWDTDTWNQHRYTALRDRLIDIDRDLAAMRETLESVRRVTDQIARLMQPLRAVRRRLRRMLRWRVRQKAP